MDSGLQPGLIQLQLLASAAGEPLDGWDASGPKQCLGPKGLWWVAPGHKSLVWNVCGEVFDFEVSGGDAMHDVAGTVAWQWWLHIPGGELLSNGNSNAVASVGEGLPLQEE